MVSILPATTGASLEYRLNNGAWQPYTRAFDLHKGGRIEIRTRLTSGLPGDIAEITFDEIIPLRELDKRKWSVLHVDSVEPGEGYAKHAIDNDPATFWHTNWSGNQAPHPHELQIDLGQTLELLGFTQLPRQDSANGRMRRYRFYVSKNRQNWGEPVAQGQFPNSGSLQTIKFAKPITGQFIRIVATDEWGRQYYTTLAELDIMAKK